MTKTLKIPIALHQQCKLASVKQGVKLQAFVEQALLAKLEPTKISADCCVHGVHFSLPCKECRQIKK